MNLYEAIMIFHPKTPNEKLKQILSRFENKIKDNKGEIDKTEEMSFKRLAFIPKKHKDVNEGIYVLMVFKGDGNTVAPLRNMIRIQEEIIRFSIIKKEWKKIPELEKPPQE